MWGVGRTTKLRRESPSHTPSSSRSGEASRCPAPSGFAGRWTPGPGAGAAVPKKLTMAEELALKKAKINQGKEIDENKLNQGTDDGGSTFQFHGKFLTTKKIRAEKHSRKGHILELITFVTIIAI